MATYTDPVCGMSVDERTAHHESTYQGKTTISAAQNAKDSSRRILSSIFAKRAQSEDRDWLAWM